jgi:hypothetical protein
MEILVKLFSSVIFHDVVSLGCREFVSCFVFVYLQFMILSQSKTPNFILLQNERMS